MRQTGLEPANSPAAPAGAFRATAEPTRERQAKREIGRTRISRLQAAVLTGMFLAVMSSAAVVQHLADLRRGQVPQMYDIRLAAPIVTETFTAGEAGLWDRTFRANAALLKFMDEYETALEETSEISKLLLPRVQRALLAVGAGNEKAYPGRNGWLFYRPDVDYVSGPGFLEARQLRRRSLSGNEYTEPPQPDPRPAILHFRDQLAARGIELIVMPTPVKPQIHPDRFTRRYNPPAEPLHNPSFAQFLREMHDAGVSVYDPTATLLQYTYNAGAAYLDTDTHWTPQAMRAVAAELAAFLEQRIELQSRHQAYHRRAVQQEQTGDIAAMLRLPESQRIYPPQPVTIDQVYTGQDELWRPDRQAEVLLLGDSFTNIYSLEAMGWGAAAGLAEQLSVELGRPVDLIARNDAGAHATRQILSQELARGRDRLAGKRVVIWQFAARELAHGDWKRIDLHLGEARPGRFITAEPGEPIVISGTIQASSGVPRPGSVPYADHIVSIHLIDVEVAGVDSADTEALVLMWSMRDNVWTEAARYRPGQRLENLRLVSWDEVQHRLGGINRSELDDPDLMFEEPNWAEVIE